ncbi:Asp23/Gls24 family envelope stress response protein [Actinomycetes bacterium M1A6_2h]
MTTTPDDPSITWADLPIAEQADAIAAATLAVDGVAALHGGMFGEVGTYLPGRRVDGVRVDASGVDVHVSVTPGASVPKTARAVKQAVADGMGSTPVTVTVEDVLPTSTDPDHVQ